MISIPGPAPIVDFDGTLALLAVDWHALRRRLSVARIADLWLDGDEGRWGHVTDAEVVAAAESEPVVPLIEALDSVRVRGFAVLTDNSERAVASFLDRYPSLAAKTRLVAGRETLRGPKTDPERFGNAFCACRDATAADRGGGPVVYVGDREYELALAAALGAVAVHVDDLG